MPQTKGYVDASYLEDIGAFVSHLKERSYAHLELEQGDAVLDVGCGPGTDTFALGKLVGEKGRVVGVDYDQAMIAEAESRAADHEAGAWVEHRQADSASLPFDDSSFDACRSERLFQHLPDPEPTLKEMVRVTKPDGRLVVLDTDWGSLSIDTPEVDVERRLARVLAERHLHNGYSGRQLRRLFLQQGLADVRIELHPLLVTSHAFARKAALLDEAEALGLTAGALTKDEVRRWRESLDEADADGVFFGSVNQVMAVGRRPALA
jgi:SAM-dependent methyltransferase